jgi:hypothetical protein
MLRMIRAAAAPAPALQCTVGRGVRETCIEGSRAGVLRAAAPGDVRDGEPELPAILLLDVRPALRPRAHPHPSPPTSGRQRVRESLARGYASAPELSLRRLRPPPEGSLVQGGQRGQEVSRPRQVRRAVLRRHDLPAAQRHPLTRAHQAPRLFACHALECRSCLARPVALDNRSGDASAGRDRRVRRYRPAGRRRPVRSRQARLASICVHRGRAGARPPDLYLRRELGQPLDEAVDSRGAGQACRLERGAGTRGGRDPRNPSRPDRHHGGTVLRPVVLVASKRIPPVPLARGARSRETVRPLGRWGARPGGTDGG